VHQSFAGIGDVCRKHGTIFLADTVCSLGGVPFFGDAWGVDAMYTGSQKARFFLLFVRLCLASMSLYKRCCDRNYQENLAKRGVSPSVVAVRHSQASPSQRTIDAAQACADTTPRALT
jgi:hypothetical protein